MNYFKCIILASAFMFGCSTLKTKSQLNDSFITAAITAHDATHSRNDSGKFTYESVSSNFRSYSVTFFKKDITETVDPLFAGFSGSMNDQNPQYLISAFCEALDDVSAFKDIPHFHQSVNEINSLKIRDSLGANDFYEVFVETMPLKLELKKRYAKKDFYGSDENPFVYLDKKSPTVFKVITLKINGKDILFPFDAYSDICNVGLPADGPWMEKRNNIFVLHIQGGHYYVYSGTHAEPFFAEYYFDKDKYIGRKINK